MRIRSVNIRSFGTLREKKIDLDSGMTVLHGPNESGKTTMMEFIRSVIVPSNKKNHYPERSKTDSGELMYEQDGEVRTARLVQRTVHGDIPRLPTGTDDPSLFRSVFAMTPADLDDEKVVTEGGVKSRFLTVPGGESMPAAMKASEDLWSGSLGKRSNSGSRVLDIQKDIDEVDSQIASAKVFVDSYGELDARRKTLLKDLRKLEAESAKAVSAKTEADVYKSNRPNYNRLSELRKQRSELGEFVPVTQEDIEKHNNLANAVSQRQSVLDALMTRRENEDADLMGADRRKVLSYSKSIESLPGKLVSYKEDARRLMEILEPMESRSEPRPQSSGSLTELLFYVGVLLLVVGTLAALFTNHYTAVLFVAGAALAALGLKRRSSVAEPASAKPHLVVPQDAEEIRLRMSQFEGEVSQIMADIGLQSHGIEDDVAILLKVKEAAFVTSRSDTDVMRARMELGDARNKLMAFTQRFSGEEGFIRSVSLTSKAE